MTLTQKERILRTFKGETIDKIPFSPRLYYWYNANKLYLGKTSKKYHKTTIPEEYLGKSQIDIYKKLGSSPRYIFETFYISLFHTIIDSDSKVEIKTKKGNERNELITKYITPKGILTKLSRDSHIIDYPIKEIKDIEIMKEIIEASRFIFDEKNFNKAKKQLGNHGVISEYIPRSPLMKLIVDYIGFSRTIIFLKKYPNEIEEFLKFLEISDNSIYKTLESCPLKIINFGENIDANLTPPPYFEKYLLPYYEKRVKQLQRRGKYCHIHMDGSLRDLLPYLESLPFDGLEALTPIPQGDVKIKEIKKSLGSKILLDGIPSILFLPEYSFDFVEQYTQKILETFSPNLILGVSDEFPPNGQVEKLEMISELVNQFDPY
jgi:uroporphyrinogen-III decarboxylase